VERKASSSTQTQHSPVCQILCGAIFELAKLLLSSFFFYYLLMRSTYYLLPTALVLSASFSASAQLINDPTAATAARDSLFQQVAAVRQQVEAKAKFTTTKAFRAGARRIIVQGYYPVQNYYTDNVQPTRKAALAWKHKIVHYHNGSTRELFTAYLTNEKRIIQERRHNGEVTWMQLQSYTDMNRLAMATLRPSGTYTAKYYLKWNGKNYLLPARLPQP